jgi:hypothetical protein
MLYKIKSLLILLGFGAGTGFGCYWMISAWIEKGYAPVDTIGGTSSIGAAITSTLLIGLFGICSVGCLIGAGALLFVPSDALADNESEDDEEEDKSQGITGLIR